MKKNGQQVAQVEDIKAAIREKYGTAHAFCRANPVLKRSTVYLVLSGKYPGNQERQTAKIREALEASTGGAAPQVPRLLLSAQEAHDVLQGAKCAHCRKLDKRGCPECNTQTEREAQALERYLLLREERT